MSALLAILDEMRGRPVAIYIGSTSLTKLADFLRGCEHAVQSRIEPNDTFLGEFGDWVHQRFNTKLNEAWEKVILKHSADDADAVDRFWHLIDEFLRERPGSEQQATVPANGASAAAGRGPA